MRTARKHRPITRVAVLAAATLLALSGMPGIGTAATSATCYGDGCGGKDPNAAGCSADARTLAEFTMTGSAGWRFLVEMRYSAACHASWTRLSHANNPDCIFSATAWHWAYQTGTGISNFSPRITVGHNCSAWTVMMSKAGRVNRACGVALDQEYCTPPK
ncbi:DUF2690 domain-containing protein [Nonomuraea sp. NPDC004297]